MTSNLHLFSFRNSTFNTNPMTNPACSKVPSKDSCTAPLATDSLDQTRQPDPTAKWVRLRVYYELLTWNFEKKKKTSTLGQQKQKKDPSWRDLVRLHVLVLLPSLHRAEHLKPSHLKYSPAGTLRSKKIQTTVGPAIQILKGFGVINHWYQQNDWIFFQFVLSNVHPMCFNILYIINPT